MGNDTISGKRVSLVTNCAKTGTVYSADERYLPDFQQHTEKDRHIFFLSRPGHYICLYNLFLPCGKAAFPCVITHFLTLKYICIMKKATLFYTAMLLLATGLAARFAPSSVFEGVFTHTHTHTRF